MYFNFKNRSESFTTYGHAHGRPDRKITIIFSSCSIKFKFEDYVLVKDASSINSLSVSKINDNYSLLQINGWEIVLDQDEATKLVDLIA